MPNDLAFKNLIELSQGWLLDLSWNGQEWTLTIRGLRTGSVHVYTGIDLGRIINHAWAGAPGGRV